MARTYSPATQSNPRLVSPMWLLDLAESTAAPDQETPERVDELKERFNIEMPTDD